MSSVASTSVFNEADLELHPGEVIRRHSRSFSIACRMLPVRVRSSVQALYAWCRAVDDAVDSAASPQAAELELCTLEDDLNRMSRGQTDTLHPASRWLKPLVVNGSIDVKHAQDLIARDANGSERSKDRNQCRSAPLLLPRSGHGRIDAFAIDGG